MENKTMRVRFAPSPTGPLHIGGARSALFNWLLAKKNNGKFVLRIEDTDLERSSKESEDNIKDSLRWLGLDWDEGIDIGGPGAPYRQTERLDIYKEYTERLLSAGKAYYCYCTDDELEEERQSLIKSGKMPRYMGKCRHLTDEQKAAFEKEDRKPTVRFLVPPDEEVVVNDLIRGRVVFDSNGIGDFVIVKSDGIPTYNYAVTIDDAHMQITHVIRGEEHLSNTPRQVLIYQALGLEMPLFGHVSLILGKDRTKMSKRHGSTSVEQYKKNGYLPEGLLNFLVLLGWSPTDEQEIFTLDELIDKFSIEHCAKSPAVFEPEKLNWINAHHIRNLSDEALYDLAMPQLLASGLFLKKTYERSWLVSVVATTREHVDYAGQIPKHIKIYFDDEFEFENDDAKQAVCDKAVWSLLEAFKIKVMNAEDLAPSTVKALIKTLGQETGLTGKKLFMPVRVALTGQTHGPEMAQIVNLLGADRVGKRIDYVLEKVKNEP